jgi:hypothetical protein
VCSLLSLISTVASCLCECERERVGHAEDLREVDRIVGLADPARIHRRCTRL